MSTFIQKIKELIRIIRKPTPPDVSEGKRAVGKYGEELAARLLRKKGYRIREQNYRIVGHEIDIIAENRRFVIFCEVKTRTMKEGYEERFGTPGDGVRWNQRKNIKTAAAAWLMLCPTNKEPRFDIVEVSLVPSDGPVKVEYVRHREDAFR